METNHQHLAALFEKVTEELIQLLNSLNEHQLNHPFVPGKWTPAQLGFHLYKSYASIEIMNGATEVVDRPIDEKIPQFREVLLNFEERYQAPKEVVPPAEVINKEKLLKALHKRIMQHRKIWKKADLSCLCMDFAIPDYGHFTRLEWLAFNTFHTLRHVQQLTEQLAHARALA